VDRSSSRESRHYSSRRERETGHGKDRNPSWMKRGAERNISPSLDSNPISTASKHLSTISAVKIESTSARETMDQNIDHMEIEETPVEEVSNVLTDKEMNELNAKIFKAEMLGNLVSMGFLMFP